MSERVWRPEWSSEVEQAWSELDVGADPRTSIRQRPRRVDTAVTKASGAHRTRPLDDEERLQIQEHAPEYVPAPSGRRSISVAKAGEKAANPEILLKEEIGSGGMGRVFRARQTSLDREIAVKQLTPQESLPDAVAHFESEAAIAAVLDHPNIVPVHDMGTDQEGVVFYTMKLIDGTPWDDLLYARSPGSVEAPEGGKHDLRGHIKILLEVANAVAFAHSKGIIHRDIKPQNVMVGEYGEVLLVDWGLAISLQPVRHPQIFDLSQVLVTCGTPAYMPPEISTGQRDWVGPWTDVFMLGAVLFEVLYGLPPHDDKTAIDVIKVASRNEWHFPEMIMPALEPFHEVLKPVVVRALATHPSQRYPDGEAFGDAVREALRHLDSAELSGEAVATFRRIEAEEASEQQQRRGGPSSQSSGSQRPPSTQERYEAIAGAIVEFEQALAKWPLNPAARHYIVEAHLLHAHVSLQAGDLMLAQTHLQALDSLPAHTVAAPEQAKRAEALRRRLESYRDSEQRRRRSTLLLQIGAALLVVALVGGGVISSLLISRARDRIQTERNHLSRLLIGTASDGIEAELDGLFAPVRGSLRAGSDWAEAGRLDTDDPAVLAGLYIPLVDGFPVISAVIRADDRGHEYFLSRRDGGWRTRLVVPGEPTRFQDLDPSGSVLKAWTDTIDYDPHTRPWYVGATSLTDDDDVYWTEPYTFFTSQAPGITASRAVRSPTGRRFVLGVDVLLTDLSAFTMEMPNSEHGKVFVTTEDDLVIGLPRSDRFADADARTAAVLTPLADLGEAVPAAAMSEWNSHWRAENRPFRLEVQGSAWWAGFRAFDLGTNRRLWIGVVLPESEFSVPNET